MGTNIFKTAVSQGVLSVLMSMCVIMTSMAIAKANDDQVQPDELVSEIFTNINQKIKQNKDEIKADKQNLLSLAEELLGPYISFETMSKQILGKNWRKITPDQRKRYTQAFKNRVSLTMVNQYDPKRDYDLKVTGSRTNKKGDRAAVATEVVDRANGTKYNISYKMFMDRKTKNWQVYDVAVEGVSVLQSFKTASAEDFKRNGIEHMISQLENGVVKGKKTASVK